MKIAAKRWHYEEEWEIWQNWWDGCFDDLKRRVKGYNIVTFTLGKKEYLIDARGTI